MHELSIATQLIETVLAAAAEHGAAGVDEVVVEIGAMRMIAPEALSSAFEIAAEGTPAEGARVTIVELPLGAKCRACGREYEPGIDNYLCPACGEADLDIVRGNDIVLRTIGCRMAEENRPT